MAINFPEGTQELPAGINRGSEHTLSSNSSVTWTGIPEGVKEIKLSWHMLSQSSNATVRVRIGDTSLTAGSFYTTGYESTAQHINQSGGAGGRRDSTGFEIYGPAASYYGHGHATLTLETDGTNDTWVWSFVNGQYNAEHVGHGGGYRSLAADHRLDRVELEVNSGTFDNGACTLFYYF